MHLEDIALDGATLARVDGVGRFDLQIFGHRGAEKGEGEKAEEREGTHFCVFDLENMRRGGY